MRLDIFVIIFIVVAAIIGLIIIAMDSGRSYIAHDGTICYSGHNQRCGFVLYDCVNGKQYFCENDVVVINE